MAVAFDVPVLMGWELRRWHIYYYNLHNLGYFITETCSLFETVNNREFDPVCGGKTTGPPFPATTSASALFVLPEVARSCAHLRR